MSKFFRDSTDITKRLNLDVSSVSTGTVRTLRAVDRDTIIADIRVVSVDTSAGDVSVEFNGVHAEMVIYRNDGANQMTITAPVGLTFSDGTSSLVTEVENGNIALVRFDTVIHIAGTSSPDVLYGAAFIPSGATPYGTVRINSTADGFEMYPKYQVLTDAANIAWNVIDGYTAEVTLTDNRTLGYPTGIEEGDELSLIVFQDGTGARTLAFHANFVFEGDPPVVSDAPNSFTILTFIVRDFGGTLKLVGPSTPGTVAARITIVDTSAADVSLEFDGEEGEIRTYRNDGTHELEITAPSGITFPGGGTDISTTVANATISLMLNGTEIEIIGQTPISSVVGYTNLSVALDDVSATIYSSTGNDATIPTADNTYAGLLKAGVIHASSGSSTLPTTAARIGQMFIRGGATNPGLYTALDTVGNWSGPIT